MACEAPRRAKTHLHVKNLELKSIGMAPASAQRSAPFPENVRGGLAAPSIWTRPSKKAPTAAVKTHVKNLELNGIRKIGAIVQIIAPFQETVRGRITAPSISRRPLKKAPVTATVKKSLHVKNLELKTIGITPASAQRSAPFPENVRGRLTANSIWRRPLNSAPVTATATAI